jgi:hypothetical protein
MILMIDPCNSNADLSKVTALDAFLYVFPFVPYSELNKEQAPYSLFDFNIFSKYFYAAALFNDFIIDPNNSYADISEITASAVSFGKFSSVTSLFLIRL